MKYELVSLSVVISNKLFRKEENKKLDDNKLPKADLEAAYAAGFIKPVGSKAKTPADVIKQYQTEQSKAADEEAEKVKADAEAVAEKQKAINEADEAVKAAKEALVRAESEAKEDKDKKEAAKSLEEAAKSLEEAEAARAELDE